MRQATTTHAAAAARYRYGVTAYPPLTAVNRGGGTLRARHARHTLAHTMCAPSLVLTARWGSSTQPTSPPPPASAVACTDAAVARAVDLLMRRGSWRTDDDVPGTTTTTGTTTGTASNVSRRSVAVKYFAVAELAPHVFVPRVRARMLQLVLSANGPVLPRSLLDTLRASIRPDDGGTRASVLELEIIHMAHQIDYAVALHRLTAGLPPGSGTAALEKVRRALAGHVRTMGRTPLAAPLAKCEGGEPHAPPAPPKSEDDAWVTACVQAAMRDAQQPQWAALARAYESLYARSAAPLLSSAAAAAGGGMSDMDGGEVLAWLPAALLQTDPLLRVSPYADGGVCAPVQPSLLMAAMDPMRLPSLREYASRLAASAPPASPSSSPPPRAPSPSPDGASVKGMADRLSVELTSPPSRWPLACSLAHCTDATRALAGVVPPPRRPCPREGGEDQLARALVRAWVAPMLHNCGNPKSALEECLGCLPSRLTSPIHSHDASDGYAMMADGEGGEADPDVSSQPTSSHRHPLPPLHRGRSADGSRNEWARRATGWNEGLVGSPHLSAWILSATGAPGAGEDAETWNGAQIREATHPPRGVSDEGAEAGPVRAATASSHEAVEGPKRPTASPAASTAPSSMAAHHTIFGRMKLITERPESLSVTALLEVNRWALQPLWEPMLAAPISLARLATLLRWHVTLPIARHYHHSLLYFLLVYAANPTVHRAQVREERAYAVLSSGHAPVLSGVDRRHTAPLPETAGCYRWAGRRHRLAVLNPMSDGGGAAQQELAEAEVHQLLAEVAAPPLTARAPSHAHTPHTTAAAAAAATRLGPQPAMQRALRRAGEQERLRASPLESAAVLYFRHGGSARPRGPAAAVDELLDTLATCPVCTGRLLLVRLRRQDEHGRPTRPWAGDTTVELWTIDVIDTDSLLPQEAMEQLGAVATALAARKASTGVGHAEESTAGPAPSLPLCMDHELGEDLLCFPLSRRVFFARVYAVAMRWQATLRSPSRSQPPPPLTLHTLARLTLWAHEYGAETGVELLAAYLLRFPDLVQLGPEVPERQVSPAEPPPRPLASRTVIFTVS